MHARWINPWSLACQGHRIGTIQSDAARLDEAKLEWGAQWSRPTVNVVATTTRTKTIGWATRRLARDQDGWDQLNQTAFVTNPPFPLWLRGSPLSSTHLRVRTLALSFMTRSFVIRYTWDEQTISLFFGVIRQDFRLLIRTINRRSQWLLIERNGRVRLEKLKHDHCVIYCCGRNRFLALGPFLIVTIIIDRNGRCINLEYFLCQGCSWRKSQWMRLRCKKN